MSKHDDDDLKKAEKLTEQEMLDSAERGRRWSNAGDFWDDFWGKFQDNVWLVKYGWIVVAVIIIVIIISVENSPKKAVCDHNIATKVYSVKQMGPNFVLEGFCTLCEKDFIIHSASSEFVEYKQPNCEDMGANVYKAVFTIGNTRKEVFYEHRMGPMLGHLKPDVLIEEYVPATCEHEGHYESYICDRCNKKIEGTVIAKKPHTEVVVSVDVEPTCLSEGRAAGSYCSVCETILTGYEILPIVPCSYNSVVTEPTYTTKGYTTHTCIWCEDTYDDSFVNALVYNYVNLSVIKGRESEGLYITSIAEGCTEESITIPEEVDGVKVVGVYENAFKNIKTLKSITLPSTVKNIFNNAFENCENLTTINLDENITFIGSEAFKGCKSLTNVTLNSKIENLKSETFADCVNLKSITLNSTIKNIEEKVFYNCKQLLQIVLPETLSSVDATAFNNCIRLVEVYDLKNSFSSCYPSSVLSVKTSLDEKSGIEVYGDYECVRGNDTNLYVLHYTPSTQEKYVMPKKINNEDFILLPHSLSAIKNFTDITITNVAQDSFKKLIAEDLAFLSASMQVTNLCLDIEKEVPSGYFGDCFEGIEKVVIKNLMNEQVLEAEYLEELEMPILYSSLNKLFRDLVVPYTLKKITFTSGEVLPQNYCKQVHSLTDVILPDSLLTIGSSAFNGCENLKNVVFGNSLETIGESAFYACYALKELAFPNSLEVINGYAFKYCSAIERVVIPENVKTISTDAFAICVNINKVINLSSLNIVARASTYGKVAENVYYVYSSLDEENKIFVEGDYVFVLQKNNTYHLARYTGEDEVVILPETYNGESYTLDSRAFENCYNIKSLTISGAITEIPANAFKSLSSLESVVICEGITSIGGNAFSGCVELKDLTLPKSLASIDSNAFYECGMYVNTQKTVYYNGTTLDWLEITFVNEKSTPMSFASKILVKAGEEYESVTSLTIPNTVTKINAYQFYGFSDITSLVVPNSVKTIKTKAFYNVTNVVRAEIPAISGVFTNRIEEVVVNTNIPQNFFSGWNNLKTVTLAEGVTVINKKAFINCASLTKITIPKTLTKIETGAFEGCSSLTEIVIHSENACFKSIEQGFGVVDKQTNTLLFGNETTVIPNYIVNIAAYAFYNNKSVTTMVIPTSVQTIGEYAFYNCNGINDIALSNNIVSVGAYAFYNCFNITGVNLSSSTKINSIGDYAFGGCSLEVLSLPSCITSVGKGAFYNACKELESVSLPAVSTNFIEIFGGASYFPATIKSVTVISGDIPASYFSGCNTITTISIQNSTSVGEKAFYYCTGLTNITLANTIKTIGNNAFEKCSSLETISLPADLESLGASAFYNCKKIKNITIPKKVKALRTYVFYYCEALESISFEEGSEINEINRYFITGCASLTELTIPSSVTTLWSEALSGCTTIEELTIPKLEFVDVYKTNTRLAALFGGSVPSTLKKVTILSATEIPAEAFYNCQSIQSITFPDSITSIGENAFYNCNSLTYKEENGGRYLSTATNDYFCFMGVSDNTVTTFEVNASCKLVYSNAFSGFSNLESVLLPEGLVSLGDSAFASCSKLTQITLPTTLKTIGKSCFVSTKLEEIVLPKSLKSVGESAFSGLTTLTSVEFASNCELESFGKEAFKNCTALTSIDFTNAAYLKTIGESCFIGCSELTSVVFSNSIESIGASAFRQLTKVATLTLPTSLRTIGDYAFHNWTISSLTIPSAVESIGNYAFYYCVNLTEITFGDNSSITKIGDYAFYNNKLLASIDFGENSSLTEIGSFSFSLCYALTTITLPKKLTVIGESAFAYCNTLATVLFEAGSELKELKDSAFEGCTALNEIHLSKSVTKIGLAFAWANTDFTVYYGGNSTQWNNISISKGQNSYYQVGWLTDATIIYNS